MIHGMPGSASVMLPVSDLQNWLGDGALDIEPDLTVQEVADLFGRQPQTVRTWIRGGRLDAYKLRGNEYRITRRAVEEFQVRERERPRK